MSCSLCKSLLYNPSVFLMHCSHALMEAANKQAANNCKPPSLRIQGDFPASKMLNGLPGIDAERRAKLIEVLDIDPNWRMHTVSDGQRRRVQICLGLLKPFDVLLLDEITVDLDVLGRADLMQFLKEECQQRGATILYVSGFD